MTRFHVAQLNIGRTVTPIDDPRMADFVARLDAVDALAIPDFPAAPRRLGQLTAFGPTREAFPCKHCFALPARVPA